MKTTSKKTRQDGFALIVTLSLMILLTVIAVGLLTLSTITLRSSSQGSAQAVANANARMAVMLALGDIQKHLGPDQRITADALSFDENSAQPNAVGVWDSLAWSGVNTSFINPDDKEARFRGWLVSTRLEDDAEDFDYPSTAPSNAVWLSRPDTANEVANNNITMQAESIPVSVGNTRGSYAWMVTDNSTRAQINIKPENSQEIARNVANRTAATAPSAAGLHRSLDFTNPDRLISLPTAAFAAGNGDKALMKEVMGRSPALTTSSLGLLANTSRGGLRMDLTPLMEGSTNLAAPTMLNESVLYQGQNDGALAWSFARSHYQLYRRVRMNSGKPRIALASELVPNSSTAINTRPQTVKLLPVISKLQIMFSLVSHHAHVGGRVDAYNQFGEPRGNTNHAIPHLVYDPVITLYNPYDVELEFPRLRVRMSDPPVGFQFQKHDIAAGTNPWYRVEFGAGEFHGLGRFQIDNEEKTNVPKIFIMYLVDRDGSGNPGGSITLAPGEVKVFSAWVEPNWTWGLETSSGTRSFFDHAAGEALGTRDKRRNQALGLYAIPGLDWRAGLQTDHMSYGKNENKGRRPEDSRYNWEYTTRPATRSNLGEGWVGIKMSDDITVNCRPQRVSTSGLDFRVDLLGGQTTAPESDLLRTYSFVVGDAKQELLTTGGDMIKRRFNVGDIIQTPDDDTPGGKSPFAIFTMSAKTTKDPRDDSKSWVQNNFVTDGGVFNSTLVGTAAQSYDLRLQEVQDFTTFPAISYDKNYHRGYFGAIADSSDGVSVVPMYRVPLAPAASLGDWIGANLIVTSQFPRVNYAFGNSFASPIIPSGAISTGAPMGGSTRALDHSYLLNATLWDSWYFSSATNYTQSQAYGSNPPAKGDVLRDFFNGTKPMLNSRLIPYISGSGDANSVANTFDGLGDMEFSRSFAKNAMIEGAFNVNSASIDAWRTVLSSMRNAAVVGYANQTFDVQNKTSFVRTGLPVAGSADEPNPTSSVNAAGQVRWAGFRTLTDDQIEDLAEMIVEEIRKRAEEDSAPNLSLGEFVNRRPGNANGLHALKGILQTAIDRTNINAEFHRLDSRSINPGSLSAARTRGLANTAALEGNTGDGAAPMLTQGDLLTGLAPIIAVRGDTFTIRGYGEAKSVTNTVLARAWCEATVQRLPDYVDPTDNAEVDVRNANNDIMESSVPLTMTNKIFGRRFVITSFRWLNSTEI